MKLYEVTTKQLTPDQIAWLRTRITGTWKLNQQTGLIDVDGDVRLSPLDANILIPLGHVTGEFDCSGSKLSSLKGAPQSVGKSFTCDNTNITSLEGAPQTVGGDFYCYQTPLTTLVGAPTVVPGNFFCSYTESLHSLDGAPRYVGANFSCSFTGITSLEGAPHTVGTLNCRNTPFATAIESRVLQIFKHIKSISINKAIGIYGAIADREIDNILSRHLKNRDVLACQEELIDAGFGAIARM